MRHVCISAQIYCIHICSVCAHTTCISSESEAAQFSQISIVKRYLRLLRSLLLLKIVVASLLHRRHTNTMFSDYYELQHLEAIVKLLPSQCVCSQIIHGQACCYQHTQSTHTQVFFVGLFYVCRGLSCVCIGNFCVCTGPVCGCRIQHAYACANVYVCIPVYACWYEFASLLSV